MNATDACESVTLYYKQGSSDKVYQASVVEAPGGFVVTFAYGRRGTTLTTGTKTAKPVNAAAAHKIFDKLVAEKTAKGYSPGESGTPYQGTPQGDRATGVLPQLLNPVNETVANELLADPEWYMQEKFDGRRALIRKKNNEVTGINRKGLAIALPEPVVVAVENLLDDHLLLDGELIDDAYIPFDLLENHGCDIRGQSYLSRLIQLERCLGALKVDDDLPCVPVLRAADTFKAPLAKLEAYQDLGRRKREGVVFKKLSAPYNAGRPASGGDQLKFKFTASASCIVTGVTKGKRSVSLALLDGKKLVDVGKVTIPPNEEIPRKGSIIEVRYLYAHRGGSLYQPVFAGVRDDVARADCTIGQLKYKSEEEE
jgi:bifunctional non-homologous end joining protein LigD